MKKVKEKEKEAIEVKSQFISMVSHELRTLLTAIKEGISIVLDGTAGEVNTKQIDFLDTAKKNVDRLSMLINDVLDFQKLDHGKMRFEMKEHDINEIIKEAQKQTDFLVKDKGLKFSLRLKDGLPRLRFDRDKIVQVLINIISNAIKFTEKGTITITTSLEGNLVRVSVQDAGPGIKKEDISKLFHRFEQLVKGKDRKIGGMGLGLAISREIIERHKGRIWAESEFGKGTTFYFVLHVKERKG
jgi:signal transduction histidine kinase